MDQPSTSSAKQAVIDITDDDDDIYSKITTNFKPNLIKEITKLNLKNPKFKITEDATVLLNETIKVLVVEAAIRSAKVALMEKTQQVEVNHVEGILTQLMLDFL